MIEQEVGDAVGEAAGSAVDSGRARYLELYVERLWVYIAGATTLSVVLSTVLAPRSFALGLLLGFRRLSGVVAVLAAAAHGAALWVVFAPEGAPAPSVGVWVGVAGFAAVLLGCIIGPKRLRG